MRKRYLNQVFREYKCICGKTCIPRPNWLYKQQKDGKTQYYCSYNCYHKDGGDNGKPTR